MSTDLTQIKNFNRICQLDPTTSFEQLADNQSRLSKAVSSVISYIQDIHNEIDEDQISLFKEKVGFINDQFNEQSRGTPFAVGLCALQLLSSLKKTHLSQIKIF